MISLEAIIIGSVLLLNTLMMSPFFPFVPQKRKKEIIFAVAYSLVWEAERTWDGWKEKTGHIKRAHVKAKLYVIVSAMPLFRYCIIKEELVDEVIDQAYLAMEAFRKEGK